MPPSHCSCVTVIDFAFLLSQDYLGGTMEALQGAAKYVGERFDANDPCRTLRIVGDFLTLFDRAVSNIKVLHAVLSITFFWCRGWHGLLLKSWFRVLLRAVASARWIIKTLTCIAVPLANDPAGSHSSVKHRT